MMRSSALADLSLSLGLSVSLHDQAAQLEQLLIGAPAADEGEPYRTTFERRQRQTDLRQAAKPGDAQEAHRLVAVDHFQLMVFGAAQRGDARRGRQTQNVRLPEQGVDVFAHGGVPDFPGCNFLAVEFGGPREALADGAADARLGVLDPWPVVRPYLRA